MPPTLPSDAPTAVILGLADAYDMGKPRLMGRQAAGAGYLRAAIQARGDKPIVGLSPTVAAAEELAGVVRAIDPSTPFEYILTPDMGRVGETGMLYIADATVAMHARARSRFGAGAFSICGVTHTTASQAAMNEIAGILREAVMPWDALVCTSSAALETIRIVQEAEADYLRWRFKPEQPIEGPRIPVIPLGVHCDDFAFTERQRAEARQALGLAPDEVAALFVGRLVYHAKAHPFPMYRGLQLAAERTGKPVVLILSGWTPNADVEAAFRSGCAAFAPDVRLIFVEGRDPGLRDQAWAGADLFVSLSDSIQETFGLTPIEAMAAGLPVVVTDWNGYRDTVRHGVDGFRIATWAPEAGMGEAIAVAHETTAISYDRYCWATTSTTGLDIEQLAGALSALVDDAALRRTMGEAGRARARALFNWPAIYRQYQALWADLNARRASALASPAWQARLAAAPRANAANLDPYLTFGHYPTAGIGDWTAFTAMGGATDRDLAARLDHPLFSEIAAARVELQHVFAAVRDRDQTAAVIAHDLRLPLARVVRGLAQLTKMGMVRPIGSREIPRDRD